MKWSLIAPIYNDPLFRLIPVITTKQLVHDDTQMSAEMSRAFRFRINREISLLDSAPGGQDEGGEGNLHFFFWFLVAVSSELIQFVDHLLDDVSIQTHVNIDLTCSSSLKSSNSNSNNIAINVREASFFPENWQHF